MLCNVVLCNLTRDWFLFPTQLTSDWEERGGYALCSVVSSVFGRDFLFIELFWLLRQLYSFCLKITVMSLRMPSTSYERYLGYPLYGFTNRSVHQYSWCFFRCSYCTKFQMQSHLPILGIFAFFDSLLKDFFVLKIPVR